jgi:hypothetical protein
MWVRINPGLKAKVNSPAMAGGKSVKEDVRELRRKIRENQNEKNLRNFSMFCGISGLLPGASG